MFRKLQKALTGKDKRLREAVANDDYNEAKKILLNNKNVDLEYIDDKGNRQPNILIAASKQKFKMVKLLAEHGANLDVQDQDGSTLLHFAAINTQVNTIEFLLKHGAKVGITNKKLDTPLHILLANKNYLTAQKMLQKYEKSKDYYINFCDSNGKLPLNYIIESGNLDLCYFLITECNADVNMRNKHGESSLFIAVKHQMLEIAELLIKQGADVNQLNKNNIDSPLYMSLLIADKRIQKLLIQNGAEFLLHNKQHFNSLGVLMKNKHPAAVELLNIFFYNSFSLRGYSIEINEFLYESVANNNLDVTKALLEFQADPCSIFTYEEFSMEREESFEIKTTALHKAVLNGNLPILKLLCAQAKNIDAVTNHGKTALHFAAAKVQPDMVEFLLNSGASVNAVDKNQLNALHLVTQECSNSEHGHSIEIISNLIKHGINVQAVTDNGYSVLSTCLAGHAEHLANEMLVGSKTGDYSPPAGLEELKLILNLAFDQFSTNDLETVKAQAIKLNQSSYLSDFTDIINKAIARKKVLSVEGAKPQQDQTAPLFEIFQYKSQQKDNYNDTKQQANTDTNDAGGKQKPSYIM